MSNTVAISGIISRETARAYYFAMVGLGDMAAHDGGMWVPKSQMTNVKLGKPWANPVSGGGWETRREFEAEIPAWLARKVCHNSYNIRTVQACRPW